MSITRGDLPEGQDPPLIGVWEGAVVTDLDASTTISAAVAFNINGGAGADAGDGLSGDIIGYRVRNRAVSPSTVALRVRHDDLDWAPANGEAATAGGSLVVLPGAVLDVPRRGLGARVSSIQIAGFASEAIAANRAAGDAHVTLWLRGAD